MRRPYAARHLAQPRERRAPGRRPAARRPSRRAGRAAGTGGHLVGERTARPPASTPPRAGASSRATWTSTPRRRPRRVRPPGRSARRAWAGRRTARRRRTGATERRLVGLQLADEVDAAAVAVGASSATLAAASWSRFSPIAVTPSSASRSTSLAGKNLVTAISVDLVGVASGAGAGRVDARAHARRGCAASSRAALVRRARHAARGHDDPGETAGPAVAAVGVQPVVLPRAARDPLHRDVVARAAGRRPRPRRRWRACRTRTPCGDSGRPRRRLPRISSGTS